MLPKGRFLTKDVMETEYLLGRLPTYSSVNCNLFIIKMSVGSILSNILRTQLALFINTVQNTGIFTKP